LFCRSGFGVAAYRFQVKFFFLTLVYSVLLAKRARILEGGVWGGFFFSFSVWFLVLSGEIMNYEEVLLLSKVRRGFGFLPFLWFWCTLLPTLS